MVATSLLLVNSPLLASLSPSLGLQATVFSSQTQFSARSQSKPKIRPIRVSIVRSQVDDFRRTEDIVIVAHRFSPP
ncbi:hypothetical protein CsSME_00016878 [Camellia sinensis var. sinensis]